MAHKCPEVYVAARFALKEAISKAFGTGMGSEIGWQDIEIGRKENGRTVRYSTRRWAETLATALRKQDSSKPEPHIATCGRGSDTGRRLK